MIMSTILRTPSIITARRRITDLLIAAIQRLRARFFRREGISTTLVTAALAAFLSCATGSMLESNEVSAEFRKTFEPLYRSPLAIDSIRQRRVGATGYYYLVSPQGIIIYHPQSAIVGMNFSENPLVKRIMREKNGCLRHLFEGTEKVLIFRPLADGSILCLTLSTGEITDPGALGCAEFR